jgi:hypothetical protein
MIGVCSAVDGGANRLELCANLGALAALLLRDPVMLTEGLNQAWAEARPQAPGCSRPFAKPYQDCPSWSGHRHCVLPLRAHTLADDDPPAYRRLRV